MNTLMNTAHHFDGHYNVKHFNPQINVENPASRLREFPETYCNDTCTKLVVRKQNSNHIHMSVYTILPKVFTHPSK